MTVVVLVICILNIYCNLRRALLLELWPEPERPCLVLGRHTGRRCHSDLYYPCREGYIIWNNKCRMFLLERPTLKTESDLAECAKVQNNPTTNLQASVDGVNLQQ